MPESSPSTQTLHPDQKTALLTATQQTALKQCVAILDCGAQYTKVIDRRVRELNIESHLFPVSTPAAQLAGYGGIIISGGPNSVYETGAPHCDPALWTLNVPVLGICYGMQLMCQQLGGRVAPATETKTREYGQTDISLSTAEGLFIALAPGQTVLMSHGDSVTQLPEGFEVIARSQDREHSIAAVSDATRGFYGLQFHPEVELTPNGGQMLANFLREICQLTPSFTLNSRLETTLEQIRTQAAGRMAFVLVSGGVDSSVTAALLLKALGPDNVYAVHIDSGLMRQIQGEPESDAVMRELQALGLKHFKLIRAQDAFLNATGQTRDGRAIGPLRLETDPEAKRQLIGDVFFRLIQAEIRAVGDVFGCDLDNVLIAQGTLRPDLIESGNSGISSGAHTIKTHHNDVDLIREHRAKGLILEPNADLHKDEVRALGRMLGLSEALVARQPFPGPGLGVRILCTQGALYAPETYAEQNALLKAQVFNLAPNVQATLAPVKSVGVQGDGRSYKHLALIAPASPKQLDDNDNDAALTPAFWRTVFQLAKTIPNSLPFINRLAVVLNHEACPLPEAFTEATPTTLTPPVIAQAQALDDAAMRILAQHGCFSGPGALSQALAVLVPVGPVASRSRSVAIRGVITSDFMTARAARVPEELSLDVIRALRETLQTQPGLAWIMLDVTSKPPATVEWE